MKSMIEYDETPLELTHVENLLRYIKSEPRLGLRPAGADDTHPNGDLWLVTQLIAMQILRFERIRDEGLERENGLVRTWSDNRNMYRYDTWYNTIGPMGSAAGEMLRFLLGRGCEVSEPFGSDVNVILDAGRHLMACGNGYLPRVHVSRSAKADAGGPISLEAAVWRSLPEHLVRSDGTLIMNPRTAFSLYELRELFHSSLCRDSPRFLRCNACGDDSVSVDMYDSNRELFSLVREGAHCAYKVRCPACHRHKPCPSFSHTQGSNEGLISYDVSCMTSTTFRFEYEAGTVVERDPRAKSRGRIGSGSNSRIVEFQGGRRSRWLIAPLRPAFIRSLLKTAEEDGVGVTIPDDGDSVRNHL